MTITIPNEYNLLMHQIEYYSQLAKNARSFEHRIFLRQQVYGFRMRLKTYLN